MLKITKGLVPMIGTKYTYVPKDMLVHKIMKTAKGSIYPIKRYPLTPDKMYMPFRAYKLDNSYWEGTYTPEDFVAKRVIGAMTNKKHTKKEYTYTKPGARVVVSDPICGSPIIKDIYFDTQPPSKGLYRILRNTLKAIHDERQQSLIEKGRKYQEEFNLLQGQIGVYDPLTNIVVDHVTKNSKIFNGSKIVTE